MYVNIVTLATISIQSVTLWSILVTISAVLVVKIIPRSMYLSIAVTPQISIAHDFVQRGPASICLTATKVQEQLVNCCKNNSASLCCLESEINVRDRQKCVYTTRVSFKYFFNKAFCENKYRKLIKTF